jgi:glucosylceramidase
MKINTFYLIGIALSVLSCQETSHESTRESIAFNTAQKQVHSYVTADSTSLRLSTAEPVSFEKYAQPLESEIAIFVDPGKTFQSFIGIGGAITDASAETFAKLSQANQEKILNAYYNPDSGIRYTIARTNINSCDFSSGSYTYVTDNDKSLKSFDIAHDKEFRTPLIKRAISAANNNLSIFASPWSPPAWMKDNNNMLRGGKLLPEYYQSWADYYVRFIQAYEAEGIPIWGLTVQNEPMATQKWESCVYTAEEEMNFVKNSLGPTLKRANLDSRKLIVWDHNRDLILHRASTIFSDPEASKYVWGVGFHWYEDWTGGTQMTENVARVSDTWPEKNLIFTEGCNGPYDTNEMLDWKLGERYGKSMINDFNNGVVAWTDWNILLDETGGPNHVQNFCFAPIHANVAKDELTITNAYYYIGHFSKFIEPGATRVLCSSSRSQLLATAFLNPGGELVIVVMNDSDKPANYLLSIGKQVAKTTALAHSIATLVVK